MYGKMKRLSTLAALLPIVATTLGLTKGNKHEETDDIDGRRIGGNAEAWGSTLQGTVIVHGVICRCGEPRHRG
jgi:hypothetical protein